MVVVVSFVTGPSGNSLPWDLVPPPAPWNVRDEPLERRFYRLMHIGGCWRNNIFGVARFVSLGLVVVVCFGFVVDFLNFSFFIVCIGNIIWKLWNVYLSMVWMDGWMCIFIGV